MYYTLGMMEISLKDQRVLYLTKDPVLIQRQVNGENLGSFRREDLLDRVSTEAYPTRDCFHYEDDYMAAKALTGLPLDKDQWFPADALRKGNFAVIVAGSSFGSGSSREHFPLSLKAAGIRLIVAESIERICAQNCQNIGLPYLEGQQTSLLDKLLSGQGITLRQTAIGMDPISTEIISSGGLFPYFRKYPDTNLLPKPETGVRPMTGPEKIIAQHMGVPFVKPGDSGFIEADRRYSYEIFTPLSYHILKKEVPDSQVTDPSSVYLFYDHSVLDSSRDARRLAQRMREIAKLEDLTLYDGNQNVGSEGICHTIMLDKHTLPGEVILGTDSHTCMLGAAGALPIGIGATEWAASLWTNRVRIAVPSSIRFNLKGSTPEGVMAKDVMLQILSSPYIRDGHAIGKIFEFAGEGLESFPFDEQAVFTNMSVEGGAYTGYLNPNEKTIQFIMRQRGLSRSQMLKMLYHSDEGAIYENEFTVNLSNTEPYVATPGDPRNGVPISQIRGDIKVDIAYIGSCTGGKLEDIQRVAQVLENQRVNSNVRLYVQTSSRSVFQKATELGLIETIEKAGGTLLPPGCGACVNFGKGSSQAGEVTISDTNRNFPGRMGKGDVYLANPAVVAASAVRGEISSTI